MNEEKIDCISDTSVCAIWFLNSPAQLALSAESDEYGE